MKSFKGLLLFFLLSFFYIPAQDSLQVKELYYKKLIDSAGKALSAHKYKKAITLSAKLIEEGDKHNSNLTRFIGHDILGTVYTDLQDTAKAKINTLKALEYAVASKNDSLIAWANLNAGNVYADSKGTYRKAINYFKQSLEYYKEVKDYETIYLTYVNIAWAFLEQKQYDQAFVYMLKAVDLEDKHGISDNYKLYNNLMLGKYFYHKNNLENAETILLKTAKSVDKDSVLDLAKESYEYLGKVYLKKGDYKNAYNALIKEKDYGELNHEENKLNAIEVASAKFDLSQYKKGLEDAEKEKQYAKQVSNYYAVIIGVLLLALLGFFLLFRSRKNYADKLRVKNIELTNAKNKTEKLSRVKNQFFSTVSHELRTPLYGVVGISSILQEDENLKKYGQELKSLKFSADYLLALINDVLLLNKMDYQELELEKVPFRLHTLVNSIKKSFEYSLQQNNNKLIVTIDKSVPDNLIGSSVRLSQILMNLIGNATKFNENGNIWLTINMQQKTKEGLYRTLFTVKDDGIGIPKNKRESIFKEFTQVESNNYSHKGTGLGLPIVKKLLELHNSDIYLESELGEGSTFRFTLDLLENPNPEIRQIEELKSPEALKSALTSQYRDLHILVVDDNKINQKVTQGILKKNNINSSVASDGEEAIDLVKTNTYSLVLMDINMPKIDGIEATKIIRTFDKEIPIVALTAVQVDEMRIEILESGMNDILSKPYGASQFLSCILKHVSKAESIL